MTERRGGGVRFGATVLTAEELSLQAEVRAFLATELGRDAGRRPGLGMNGAASREFSRKLGARGWLGMALPRRYGGAERSAVDRFVVTEELLRYGAPVGHHWLADRQTGVGRRRGAIPPGSGLPRADPLRLGFARARRDL
jgi:alkylation response protein AidB-like acyl-CoA dehydrogenase